MTTQLIAEEGDEDDDDWDLDEDEYPDFLHENAWEDHPAYLKIIADMPKGWNIVKVVNFTNMSISQMENWLKTRCEGKYKQVGFKSGCSYMVAVEFEMIEDAVMFKMRWKK